jgi:hypothetical protein
MTFIKNDLWDKKMKEKLGSQNCSCCKIRERVLCGKVTKPEYVLRRFLPIVIDSVNEDLPYGTQILWLRSQICVNNFVIL